MSRSVLGRALGAVGRWRSRTRRSSVSDIASYRNACSRAARDPSTFSQFRRDPAYTEILEHVTPLVAAEAARIALERFPAYRDYLEEFRRNDTCGGPFLHSFADIGAFAPTTLRYVKVLSDLETLFGDLSGWRIVEIGGGYGGQCRIIRARFAVKSYTIYDLPEAAELASRYLEAFGFRDVSFNPPSPLEAEADLVLSNYALSEIRRSSQDEYLAGVVRKAARGYMIWNETATRRAARVRLPAADRPYAAEDVAKIVPRARIERELPLLLSDDVARGNVLIRWS
jgi:hypothetical protein